MMADLSAGEPVRVSGDESVLVALMPWEPWFAWHPIKLYMSRQYAWMRWIWRRSVDKNGIDGCDFTDAPEDFPG